MRRTVPLHAGAWPPRRLADAVRDGRREAQDDLVERLVGDDVPRGPQRGRGRRRIGRVERLRGQRRLPDPLDLECPERAALDVEAD